MPMYGLIEYSDVYSKTSRNLLQYYRDESALNKINNIFSFPANNNKFKFKQQNRKQEKQEMGAQKILT